MARRWHFFCAWLFVVNGLTFVTYIHCEPAFAAGSSSHQAGLAFDRQNDYRSSALSTSQGRGGQATTTYCRKCAYLVVIFFLLPLMILMGLGMSPAMDALYPRLGGSLFRPTIREDYPFHRRLGAGAVRDHSCVYGDHHRLLEQPSLDDYRILQDQIGGEIMSDDDKLTRRSLLTRLLAGAGVVVLGGCEKLSETTWFPKVLGLGEKATYKFQRLILPRKAMAQEFSATDLSPAIPQQRDVNAEKSDIHGDGSQRILRTIASR